MATTVGYSPNVGTYWNLIKNLDADMKIDLISLLSDSLRKKEKPAANNTADSFHGAWIDELAGRWEDDRTTEQIVSDIREARTSNREIEL